MRHATFPEPFWMHALLKRVRSFFITRIVSPFRRIGLEAGQQLGRRRKLMLPCLGVAALLCGAVYELAGSGQPLATWTSLRGEAAASAARTIMERARVGEADPFKSAGPATDPGAVTYTQFLSLIRSGEVGAAILVEHAHGGELLTFETKRGQYGLTILPNQGLAALVLNLLVEHEVEILTDVPPMISGGDLGALARILLPFLLVGAGILFMLKRGPAGTGTPGEWIAADKNSARFPDIQGVDEAKAELVEAVQHLVNPGAALGLGAKPPRGVLLVGPPGTGKTMLARAVAGEAGAAFLRLSGSDFVEMWVGLGARRVRAVFKAARRRAPCVIFIDELDSLGRKRGAGGSGAAQESDQTLNALLVELDGFSRDDGVLVLAATNRVDTLDDALLRPGRFDRHVHVGLPDMAGRLAILQVHAQDFKLDAAVDLAVMARGTPGFSGAELANIINEAAFGASRRGAPAICDADLEEARDRTLMGSERKTLARSADERILTAWHEAGHALVAVLTPAADPVHKATIMPRGGALGMVMQLPQHDRFAVTRAKLEADLTVAVGGRIAEELKFGGDRISTGAEADIKAATDLAHSMVARWGMSEKLGFVHWANDDAGIPEPVRREMKDEIDRALLRARDLITGHRAALDGIAEALLESETLGRSDLERIVARAAFSEVSDRRTA